MTTILEHSDKILATQRGAWLMACDPVKGVNIREGGPIHYGPGAKFRVDTGMGNSLIALDEDGRSVMFGRPEMAALERMVKAGGE
ncbi:MAG: hypothetical protein CML68_13530 [Rhodobacteraceae bacterium]|nr:hypothetical protein [Paracoccaceae bacterium]